MQKGLLCLSLDDGRKDQRQVAEYLLEKSIPATFNITTGYVDRTCPEELAPSKKEALNIEDVCWINEQALFEVALHGNNHFNTIEDIQAGRDKTAEWLQLPKEYRFGFASPGSNLDLDLITEEKSFFDEKITYVRLGLRLKCKRRLRIIARKVSRVLHVPFLYRFAYADTLMNFKEVDKVIYSVPIMGDITYKQVRSLVNMCAKRGKVLVLMLHSIEEKPLERDKWSWEKEKFEMLCEYMSSLVEQDKIEILNVQELYNRSKGIS